MIEITNIKLQISNNFQHAAQAPALRVTEIRKSKQYLVLEGFGHLILEFEICLNFGACNL